MANDNSNDQDLISAYLAKHTVTQCPPVSGLGANSMSVQLKDTVRQARKDWKDQTGLSLTA